jgi:hypothetical protein
MALLGQYSYSPLQSATTNITSPTVDISGFDFQYGPVAHIIITNATVTINGSIDNTNWSPVATLTSSDLYVLDPRIPYYQFVITNNTGSVTVNVGPGMVSGAQIAGVRSIMVRSAGPQ